MSDIELSYDLRNYLSSEGNSLIDEGIHLIDEAEKHMGSFRDFSFVVFPFAKSYEGFLKQIFYDLGFISGLEYRSRHFRIGKVMSPNLQRRLRNKSIYGKICNKVGCELSDLIWNAWKEGRNEIFHFYTNGVKSISLQEAKQKSKMLVMVMETTYRELRLNTVRRRLQDLIRDKSHPISLN